MVSGGRIGPAAHQLGLGLVRDVQQVDFVGAPVNVRRRRVEWVAVVVQVSCLMVHQRPVVVICHLDVDDTRRLGVVGREHLDVVRFGDIQDVHVVVRRDVGVAAHDAVGEVAACDDFAEFTGGGSGVLEFREAGTADPAFAGNLPVAVQVVVVYERHVLTP